MSGKSQSFDAMSSEESEWSLAGEYSAMWSAGVQPPDLVTFLRDHPGVTPAQRARLLLHDQARTWSGSTGRTLEDYLRICPEIADDRTLLVKLLSREYCLQDSVQSVSDFVDRFPTLRTELLRKLYGDYDTGSSEDRYEQILDECLSDGTQASDLDPVSESLETAIEASVVAPRRAPQCTDEDATKARVAQDTSTPAIPMGIGDACYLRDCFPFNTLPAELVDQLESQMVERTFAAQEDLSPRRGL
jgi:hypothetical protein